MDESVLRAPPTLPIKQRNPTAPKTVECIATCEIDLSALWDAICTATATAAADDAGDYGRLDYVRRRFVLQPTPERAAAYPSGCAGVVTLTVVAGRALAALKRGVQ
jgi:hypothetical protein